MSVVRVISDLHLGHRNICKYRPQFNSAKEHDQTVVDNILSVAGKRNVLWLLGDCFFTLDSINHLKEIAQHYMQVNLVLGNHDTDNKERQLAVREGLQYITKIGSLFKYNDFWLSHHPIHPIELRGKKNIHGHVHEQTIEDTNYLNVCCENVGYVPVVMKDLELCPADTLTIYGEQE